MEGYAGFLKSISERGEKTDSPVRETFLFRTFSTFFWDENRAELFILFVMKINISA